MNDLLLPIIGLATAVFGGKYLWEDRKHARETKADLKGKNDEIKRLNATIRRLSKGTKKRE